MNLGSNLIRKLEAAEMGAGRLSGRASLMHGHRTSNLILAGLLIMACLGGSMPARAGSDDDPEEPFRRAARGDSLFALGEIEKAKAEYTAAYESARSFQAGTKPHEEGECLASYGLARVALEQGEDPKVAEKHLKSCKNNEEYEGRYLLGMGLTRYRQEKLDEAEKLFIQGASRMDRDRAEGEEVSPIRLEIGEALIDVTEAKGLPLVAATRIDELVRLAPEDGKARLYLKKGRIYVDAMQYDEALEAFGAAMKADSTLVEAYRESAEIFYRDKGQKYDAQAAMALGRMATAVPSAENYILAGDAWLKAKQAANALLAYEEALELDPGSSAATLGLARAAMMAGDRERAAEAYQSLSDQSQFTADDYEALGRALLDAKEYAKARQAFDRAFEIDPTRKDAVFYSGYTHFAAREFAESIPYFERRVAIDSTSTAAFVNLGLAYWQTGQVKRGVENLRVAVNQRPDDTRTRMWLAQALAADKQWSEAVSEYRAIIDQEPDNAAAWRGIGYCKLQQESFGEAVNALAKADAIEPGDVQTLVWLGQGYGLATELDKAEAVFNRVLKISPNNKEALEMLEMIKASKSGKKRRKPSSS